ncbi:Hint domain-containing protein [Acetobacter sp. P5B1]|uniref:Hint domain-containing protein n=1 Tax=Acetobacter sp. P5B1 TaxID=2762620 RepID=UPI001C04FB6C|nr:Hint domain-containing protein [Acetobacter sp. P5B1]
MTSVTSNILYLDNYVTGTNNLPGGSYNGSSFSAVVIQSGGTYGGTHNVLSGGEIDLYNHGVLDAGTVLNGGTISSFNNISGNFPFTWGSSGGTLVLAAGAIDAQEAPLAGSANIIIDSGATLSKATLQSGNSITVSGGGYLSNTTVVSGATAIFSAGANESGITLNGGTISAYNSPPYFTWGSGGGKLVLGSGAVDTGEKPLAGIATIVVESGATLSSATLQSGNSITVSGGGSLSNTTVVSGATAIFSAGANERGITLNGGTISAYNSPPYFTWGSGGGWLVLGSGAVDTGEKPLAGNATIVVESGATLSTVTLQSGNSLGISAGGQIGTAVVSSGAGLGVAGSLSSASVVGGGRVDVTSGGSLGATTVSSGGTVDISAGGLISGTVTVQNGASVVIGTNAGGVVDLQGDTNGGLVISGLTSGGTVNTVISGFNGTAAGNSDSIELAGLKSADVASVTYPSSDQVALALTNGGTVTLNIPGVESQGFSLTDGADGWLDYEVCFLSGSMIQTPNGEVAVETLRLGDDVTAYVDGMPQSRRVVWAGKSHATVRPHLELAEAGYPVRILKDAISHGVPYKDMLITPEHCLFFDGRFVPARMLVNGASIFYDTSITSYDYFHVETEQHSVLCADGMLTESYLDTGNRRTFRQDGSVLSLGAGRREWAADAAVPLCVERAFVEPLFHALAARADEVSDNQVSVNAVALTREPDLHLVTQTGAIIRPAHRNGAEYRFMLPPGVTSVRIVSRASRPSDVVGPYVDDRRMLGVAIADVQLITAQKKHSVSTHQQAEKLEGWYAADTAPVWTNGNAHLTLPALAQNAMSMLSLDVCAAGPYPLADQTDAETTACSA